MSISRIQKKILVAFLAALAMGAFFYASQSAAYRFVSYGKAKVLVSIQEAAVIKGALPAKQLKFVLAWCEIHKDELLANWKSAQEHGKIAKIEPLR